MDLPKGLRPETIHTTFAGVTHGMLWEWTACGGPPSPYVPNTTACLMETSSVPPSAASTGSDDVLPPASVSQEAWSAYPQRKVNGLADNVDTTQLRGSGVTASATSIEREQTFVVSLDYGVF